MKAYEDKLVNDSTIARNAFLNALQNLYRKKNKKFNKLWKKKQKKLDKEIAEENLSIVMQSEKQGMDWADLIYRANGMEKPQKKGG